VEYRVLSGNRILNRILNYNNDEMIDITEYIVGIEDDENIGKE